MSKEFILKKLRQMIGLILEMESFLTGSFSEFSKNAANIRASERNFQLLVELASDINAHLANELGKVTPENYWESFRIMEKAGVIDSRITKDLIKSTKLRNILVHEYDFDQDNFIFYKSAKKFTTIYKDYIQAVEKYLEK